MAKEYHDDYIHVIVDSKTGNKTLDQSVESTILGYAHMTMGRNKFFV